MPSRLIPLFPLQVVVFPRTPLPLHIFEERYKEMVGDAIRDNSEFGIVLAKDRRHRERRLHGDGGESAGELSRWPHGHSDPRPDGVSKSSR